MTNVDFTSNALLNIPAGHATKVMKGIDGTVLIIQDDGSDLLDVVSLSKPQAELVYLALKEFVEGC